jgi:lambda family phage portal protein
MNILDRMISAVAPQVAVKRQAARVQLQGLAKARMFYDAASQSHRTGGWRPISTDANNELRTSTERLRFVSREMVRNNPYAARAVQTITSNVVGTGIIPSVQARAARTKSTLEQLLIAHFDTPACDVTQQMNLYGLQALAMRTIIESGEVLIRRRRARASDNLPLPFQLQVLEPDYINTLIDGEWSGGASLPEGHTAVMGVEFDPRGKIAAYHLLQNHPGSNVPQAQYYDTERVPAEDIIHIYRKDRPGQVRGVTWFAPVVMRLQDFKDFADAQLMRQKLAACFVAFVTTENPDFQTVDDQTSINEQPLEYFEPGVIERLKPGEQVEFGNPPSTADFGQFSSVTLHEIAAGLGISYEALTGDLTGVNFSSGRMGWLEFQRQIDDWRLNMLQPLALDRIANWFLQSANIAATFGGDVKIKWTPPKREMISPRDEVPFAIEQVRAGLMSRSEYLRRAGFDPEMVDQEIADDNARADRLKIILDSDARHTKLVGGTAAGSTRTPASEDVAPADET